MYHVTCFIFDHHVRVVAHVMPSSRPSLLVLGEGGGGGVYVVNRQDCRKWHFKGAGADSRDDHASLLCMLHEHEHADADSALPRLLVLVAGRVTCRL